MQGTGVTPSKVAPVSIRSVEGEDMPQGIISKSLAWITHPTYADSDPIDWFAAAIVIFLIGMLWSKVLRQIVE